VLTELTVENQLAARKEENKKYGQNEANLCFDPGNGIDHG